MSVQIKILGAGIELDDISSLQGAANKILAALAFADGISVDSLEIQNSKTGETLLIGPTGTTITKGAGNE